jgi:hypothetical protein
MKESSKKLVRELEFGSTVEFFHMDSTYIGTVSSALSEGGYYLVIRPEGQRYNVHIDDVLWKLPTQPEKLYASFLNALETFAILGFVGLTILLAISISFVLPLLGLYWLLTAIFGFGS